MKKIPISALKARLSEYLAAVRAGEQILVTDRGRPIASLGPVTAEPGQSARVQELVRAGRMKLPAKPLPTTFWKGKGPADPHDRALKALLEEREQGR